MCAGSSGGSGDQSQEPALIEPDLRGVTDGPRERHREQEGLAVWPAGPGHGRGTGCLGLWERRASSACGNDRCACGNDRCASNNSCCPRGNDHRPRTRIFQRRLPVGKLGQHVAVGLAGADGRCCCRCQRHHHRVRCTVQSRTSDHPDPGCGRQRPVRWAHRRRLDRSGPGSRHRGGAGCRP